MRFVGPFEIVKKLVSGASDTYSARDRRGRLVFVHLLAESEASTNESLGPWKPPVPGAILESGIDPATKRAFVVTEYPKGRKALLLWVQRRRDALKRRPKAAKGRVDSAGTARRRLSSPAAPVGGDAGDTGNTTRLLDASALAVHLPAAAAHGSNAWGQAPPVPRDHALASSLPLSRPEAGGETQAFSSAVLNATLPQLSPPFVTTRSTVLSPPAEAQSSIVGGCTPRELQGVPVIAYLEEQLLDVAKISALLAASGMGALLVLAMIIWMLLR